jgi:hypothetical protein
MIDTLHESMDGSLQRLAELPAEGRSLVAQALISSIEGDIAVERRLLGALDIRVPGLSGVDPLSTLQQAEVDRLLVQLKEPDTPDGRRWAAALAELRLQLEAAFVAVDQALADRA